MHEPDRRTGNRARRPTTRWRAWRPLALGLSLGALISLTPAASSAFTYRTYLGGVLQAGGPIASIDLWPPDPQGRFFDDVRFLSPSPRYTTARAGHRFRALRTGIDIGVPAIRGEGSGTGVYASTIRVEIADPDRPRVADRYDPPRFTVVRPFSVPVSYAWFSEDANGNGRQDRGEFATTVRVEPLSFVLDLEAYGSILVEMQPDDITCTGPCIGGLGDVFFTWNPVPEPGTGTLVGLGLLVLAHRRQNESAPR
ncbi:MAG: PEP-CTERM sorting domain-containing protein [Myxococcota bacterium]